MIEFKIGLKKSSCVLHNKKNRQNDFHFTAMNQFGRFKYSFTNIYIAIAYVFDERNVEISNLTSKVIHATIKRRICVCARVFAYSDSSLVRF